MKQEWAELMGLAVRGVDHAADAGMSEEHVLAIAAVAGLKRKAAMPLPAAGPAPPEPCTNEEWPECTAAARELLSPPFAGFIGRWLETALQYKVRVPAAALPVILDMAARTKAFRNATDEELNVLGHRARWLASQNPDWTAVFPPDFASVQEADAVWEDISIDDRIAALKAIRRIDASKGRVFLEGRIVDESAEDRARLIRCLYVGLSLEDEDFLRSRLTDRSMEVIVASRALLAKMPGSRYARELEAIAKEHIKYSKGFLGGKLEVEQPPSKDARLLALGIKDRKGTGYSERDNLLFDMVALVHPNRWSEWTGQDEKALVKAAQKTDYAAILTKAWSEAGKLHGDFDLAELAIRAYIAEDSLNNVTKEAALNLSEERLSRLLVDIANAPTLGYLYVELATSIRNWDLPLSRELVKKAKNFFAMPGGPEGMAYSLHPGVLQSALEPWESSKNEFQNRELENLRLAIQGRLKMIQTIRETARK